MVAVGDNGAVYASTNGVSWRRQTALSQWLRGVAFGNNTFVAVGFGLANSPSGSDTTGTKRVVTMSVTSHDAVEFRYGSGSKNTCSGDSGGPALEMIDGSTKVYRRDRE